MQVIRYTLTITAMPDAAKDIEAATAAKHLHSQIYTLTRAFIDLHCPAHYQRTYVTVKTERNPQ